MRRGGSGEGGVEPGRPESPQEGLGFPSALEPSPAASGPSRLWGCSREPRVCSPQPRVWLPASHRATRFGPAWEPLSLSVTL